MRKHPRGLAGGRPVSRVSSSVPRWPSVLWAFWVLLGLHGHFLLLTFIRAGPGKPELCWERTLNFKGPRDLRNGGSLQGCRAGLHLLPRGHWPSSYTAGVTWPGRAPRPNDSRDTPSGMGCVYASGEELPARNLIRTFRFEVLSPGAAEGRVLPRTTACK